MKFVSRAPRTNTFWVEDFTEEDKEFFKSIGFTDTEPHKSEMVVKAYNRTPTLYFVGSNIFGLWDEEEVQKICSAIYEKYPEIDNIKIEHFVKD